MQEEHFQRIHAFLQDPQPVPVLQGRRGEEFLVIDEAFMAALPGDDEAKMALQWLYAHMNERKDPIVMNPGDLLLIDNRMTAHGRSAYKPNYGANARWLRRVNITTDLVKSHLWKDKPSGRIIF